MDEERTIELLDGCGRLTAEAVEAALAALELPPGSAGLDAGCGIGIDSLRLARLVGRTGSVTGVDLRPELLALARERAAAAGLEGRVQLRLGDLAHLEADRDSFDWALCRDVLWGDTLDPRDAVAELERVVRPGGVIALLFWTAHALLGAHTGLEARLMAGWAQEVPYHRLGDPSRHFMGALGWLRAAGLAEPRARSFTATLQAPLATEVRGALADALHMLYDESRRHVTEAEWSLFERLSDPGSAEFLGARDDYCGVVVYTSFTGKVVG